MKVLAVLGNSEGIDTNSDRNYLETLLGKDTATWLEQPDRQQLNEYLWQQKWDIFFFAGHSSSSEETGRIYLNATDSLTISDLKFALQNAVRNGLKLAIFNSCDGLGLARDLAELKIPHTIVMREPVPDEVAHKFLRYFLELFSQGIPLHKAVKQAREKLQGLERDLPCASWLPIIYETPGCLPITWINPAKVSHKIKLTLGAILLLITTLTGFWFYTGEQKRSLENKTRIAELARQQRISSGEKLLFSDARNAEKERGSKLFAIGNCVAAKKEFKLSLNQVKNDPETLIYYNNASICNKDNFKIVASVPVGSNSNVAREILRGVAQKQDEINRNGGINGKLLKVEIANDDNDIKIAQDLAAKFVSDREILAVVGHNASDVSVGVCSIYGMGKLVMISPTSFSLKLSRCSPYVFRTVTNVRFAADILSNFMIRKVKKYNALVCIDRQAEDNQSFAAEFRDGLYSHGVNINKTNCDLSASDFNPKEIIERAIKSGADNIMLAPHVDRIGKAIEIVKANRDKLPLFGSPTLYTSLTLKKGGENVNGMVLAVPWHPTAIPGNNFARKAEKLWGGNVTWRTAYAYDAVLVIAKALKTSDTRDGLQQTLFNTNFVANGATGKIEFSDGERNGKPYLVKIQKKPNGQGYEFVPLPSVEIINSPFKLPD